MRKIAWLVAGLCWSLFAGCSDDSPSRPPDTIDLGPFVQLAEQSSCAQVRNELFLINRRMVYWHREGNCPDAAYEQTLFGKTTDVVYCRRHDSAAGPLRTCEPGPYSLMFDTILANPDAPDLGLGVDYLVETITFLPDDSSAVRTVPSPRRP